jgi:hypothetical protein
VVVDNDHTAGLWQKKKYENREREEIRSAGKNGGAIIRKRCNVSSCSINTVCREMKKENR